MEEQEPQNQVPAAATQYRTQSHVLIGRQTRTVKQLRTAALNTQYK
jgi:hypothetical protein